MNCDSATIIGRATRTSLGLFAAGLFVITSFGQAFAQPVPNELPIDAPAPIESAPLEPSPLDSPAGRSEPGYLGMIADSREEMGRGVRVIEIVPEGPAATAGILPQDLITAIGGKAIGGMSDMAAIVEPTGPGDKLEFTIDRMGQAVALTVTLGKRPALSARRFSQFGEIPGQAPPDMLNVAGAPRRRLLGLRTVPLTQQLSQALQVRVPSGVVVIQVETGSPAAVAGIPLDAVIVTINGAPVRDPNSFAAQIADLGPGRQADIGYYVRGQLQQAQVELKDYEAMLGPGQSSTLPPLASSTPGATPSPDWMFTRIRELEARIAELEARLREAEGAPAAETP